MLNHDKCILDYPSKFSGDRNKQTRYFRELIKLIAGQYRKSSQYVSEIVPKSNEDHIVEEKDIKEGIFQKEKPRVRAVSGPGKNVSEITAAITYLVQDLAKDVCPQMALGLTMKKIGERFKSNKINYSLDGT